MYFPSPPILTKEIIDKKKKNEKLNNEEIIKLKRRN